MLEFLKMGGYAAYVWPAFGLTVVGLGGLFWQSWQLARKRDAELFELRQRRGGAGRRPARPLTPRREPGPAQAADEPR